MIRAQEEQREHLACLSYLDWNPTEPGTNSQLEAHGTRLEGNAEVTKGHRAVISHHCQKKCLCASRNKEEAHLSGTTQQRDVSILSTMINQDPGESGRHITDPREEIFARKNT